MIKTNKCDNCNKKIKKNYNFCPNCGIQLKDTQQDWGMLGKRDKEELQMPKMIGTMSGGIMNKMLGSALKMLEKEMQNEMSSKRLPATKVKLMINGKEINPTQKQPINENKKENTKNLPIEFSDSNLKKWAQRKKTEPKTKLKRIGDKIQYELEVPGVNTIKDISIIKLEKSLEVRAIGKENAYQKNIQIDLPLKKYALFEEKLTLELDASM